MSSPVRVAAEEPQGDVVSEDHCHSTFVVDNEVIGVDYHLDRYSVAIPWYH